MSQCRKKQKQVISILTVEEKTPKHLSFADGGFTHSVVNLHLLHQVTFKGTGGQDPGWASERRRWPGSSWGRALPCSGPPGEGRVPTLAAVLLRAAEVVLVVGVGVSRGAGVTAHGALPLTLQDTRLGKKRGVCSQ